MLDKYIGINRTELDEYNGAILDDCRYGIPDPVADWRGTDDR